MRTAGVERCAETRRSAYCILSTAHRPRLASSRRAQLTVFIIVGLLILAAVSSFVFINARLAEREQLAVLPPEARLAAVSGELQSFVNDCVEQVSVPIVERLASRGGSLDPRSDVFHDRESLTVYCSKAGQRDCINSAPFRQEMQDELSRAVDTSLSSCLDFSGFEDMGFDVSVGARSVSSVIGVDDVAVKLSMPVSLSVGESSSRTDDFSVLIPLPLGRLYGLAVDIANQEILRGFFDKDEWMVSHGSEIIIERHRPYPDIIYVLKKRVVALGRDFDFVFRFGIEGRETFNIETQHFGQSQPCFVNDFDGLCFQNVPLERRAGVDGSVEPGCSCPEIARIRVEGCCVARNGDCSFSTESECTGRFVKDDLLCQRFACSNLHCQRPDSFRNEPKRHLESWCTYDSLVTRGQDYRGSRHYLHTCIDGVDVVEECRDYREELCTEESRDRNGESYSKAVCRTNRWYDCASQGVSSCEDRRVRDCSWFGGLWTDRKCHPAVSPGFRFWNGEGSAVCSVANEQGLGKPFYRSWGHSAALYCQRMGDCGHYRNIADVLTKFGWSHPLDTSRLRPFVYQPAGLTAKGKDYILDLGVDNVFFDSSVQIPSGVRGGSIRCLPWRAPFGSDSCSLCASEKGKPCTEYRCRSLGQQCVFVLDKGEGVCSSSPAVDANRLVLSPSGLSEGFVVELDNDRFCPGVKTNRVVPVVQSDTPISFGVDVSEPAKCIVSVIPPCLGLDPSLLLNTDVLGPGSLPDISLSNGDVLELHRMVLSLPSPNVSKFDSLQFYVNCFTPEGYSNKEIFSYRFDVVEGANTRGPDILAFVPEALSQGDSLEVSVFASERISDCRFSFSREEYESMANTDCPVSDVTDVNYVPDAPLGSFPCVFNMTVPDDAESLFVQCRDIDGLAGSLFEKNLTLKQSTQK